MSSHTRKHLPQENHIADQSPLSATKHRALSGKGNDTVVRPFPSKPVLHQKPVNSTSNELGLKKKSKEHVPYSTTLSKESSRLPAAEAQMSRVIQEKQLMLQKKLWKLEDTLRQKILCDNAGVDSTRISSREDKYYQKREIILPDSKTKQGLQLMGKEGLRESQKDPKQRQFKQDTVTGHVPQDAKWDNVPTGKSKTEEGRATYVYNHSTQRQQKVITMLSADDNIYAAGRSIHEELVLPQASCNPFWKLEEDENTNIKLFPCHICKRKFLHDRVEKHMQICEKVTKSKRPVFNSYASRMKGSDAQEFWKTHTRSRSPEVLKKKYQKQHKKHK